MKYLPLRAANAPALLNQFRTAILFALTLCAAAAILVSGPGGRLLTSAKAATLTVCPSGCSATTINGAIALANPGDDIQVAAGTYNELVVVNKENLRLFGANAGINPSIDIRVPESIVSNVNGAFQITANRVNVVGFLVQGATGGLGAGIHAVGVSDVRIVQNIIQNNIIGLTLGGNTITVHANTIRNNNNTGAASGTGIYSDTGLTNSTVVSNFFSGHTRAALNIIGAPVVAGIVNRLDVLTNTATNDAAFSFIGGTDLRISGNLSSGASNDAMRFRGGVNGANLTFNQLTNGAAAGISVRNDFGVPNANLSIGHCNRIVGFAGAAINVDAGAYTGTLNAENNFYGCNAGPNNAGCGTIIAPDNNVDFSPWQVITLAASQGPVLSGQTSTLTAGFGSSEPGGTISCGFLGIPVTFTSTCGMVNPTGSVFDSGIARTTLVANTPGVCTSSATVDNQTVNLHQAVFARPTVTVGPIAGCVGSGSVVPVTVRFTNSSTTAQPIRVEWGRGFGFDLSVVPGSCVANVPGSCEILGSQFTFNGTLPAGQTVAITAQVQAGEHNPGAQFCPGASVTLLNENLTAVSSITSTSCISY